ncbi:MAG: HEPN domain-containing protein [Nanoarchaeota archaeon]
MNIQECLENGLLKKDKPSIEKAKKSIKISKLKLEKAENLFKLKILDMAEVNIYSSMFHASRALLYRDGLKERSHYALYIYLKEKYYDKIEPRFLNELNVLRLNRHEIFYGFEELILDEQEIRNIINLAGEFIKLIEELL